MRLKDYIQSSKRGKEANRLEREAMNDPFLQEALEGFEKVPGDHISIVDRLEKKYNKPATSPQKSRNVFLYSSIAASILLLIGFGTYLLLEKDSRNIPMYAELQPAVNERIISVDSSLVQLIQQEENPIEKSVTAEVNKKTVPAPPTNSPVNSPVNLPTNSPTNSPTSSPVISLQDKDISLSESEITVADSETLSFLSEARIVAETIEEPVLNVVIEDKVSKYRAATFDSIQSPFGEKEFQIYCQQKADKNVCAGKNVSVKVSFFIDETGKPVKIEFKNHSCEDAKKEIEKLLASSPIWTKKNRNITMTIKW